MPQTFKRTTVTSALPYANGPVHIGHLAGVYVPADIYSRYLRLKGRPVMFIGGSDEHGVPVTIRARKEGITVQEVVDRYHQLIKESFREFGISFDIYSRTTSETHHKLASDFFRKLYDEGKFVEQTSEQFYDEQTQRFLTDRNIRGECPRCHAPEAYGDQCEKCGATLSPEELINPYNAETGNPLVKKATKHWYLPLDKDQPWLEKWILEEHKEWRSNVYGQCKSWLDGGLRPRAVTRDLDWGIPVPIEGAEGKVLYVWFDAPIGYISNTKELCDTHPEWGSWETWWKDPETRLIHFIGKDNIVFHCIVFPSMLKAYGDGYILPDNVPANEFLNLEGDKISTSRNWAVWAHEYLRDFPGKEDVIRYVLTANAPETKDNDFSWKDFQTRNNSELVGIFGNFVNRAVVLTHKYFDGVVPACGELQEVDREALAEIPALRKSLEENLSAYRFREALRDAMGIARVGNKYISDTEPWKVAKTDMARTATILNVSLQICADLAIAFEPFTPFAAERLRTMLGVGIQAGTDHRKGEQTTVNTYKEGEGAAIHTGSTSAGLNLAWDQLGATEILPAGHQIGEAQLLFAKIEDDAIQAQLDRLEAIRAEKEAAAKAEAAKQVAPQKEECTFEEFEKMDIRTATVLAAERVPKTDKLLKLSIDTGIDKRTIVSGIAEYYTPEEMVGKQICILANLKPRVIRGIESRGMILMAKQGDGKMRLVSPQEAVTNGAVVG